MFDFDVHEGGKCGFNFIHDVFIVFRESRIDYVT